MVAAIPYAIAAASAYAGAANDAHALRKQDRQTAAGIVQQSQRRQEATGAVNQAIAADAHGMNGDPRQARLNEYLGALQQNRTTAGGQVGAVSDAYRQQAAAKDATVGDTSSQLAGVLSRIDGAKDQRAQEAINGQRAATSVGVTADLAKGDDFVNQTKVKAITPNPWVALLSKVGMAAGAGMSGAGFGTGGLGSLGSVNAARTAGTLGNASEYGGALA